MVGNNLGVSWLVFPRAAIYPAKTRSAQARLNPTPLESAFLEIKKPNQNKAKQNNSERFQVSQTLKNWKKISQHNLS